MGVAIDCGRLSLELGVPVVPICARTGEGVEELLRESAKLFTLAHEQLHTGFHIEPDDLYDAHTHAAHHRIGEVLGDAPAKASLPAHWAEIKLLEGDPIVREQLHLTPQQLAEIDKVIADYVGEGVPGDNETRVADSRYRYITRVCAAATSRRTKARDMTDRIDAVLTNKWLGIPIFLLIMGLIFVLTFDTLGGWLSDGVDRLIGDLLAPWAESMLLGAGAAPWLVSLLCDGVITGVSAADRAAVLLPLASGGQRVYVAHRVFNGSGAQALRPFRQVVHSDADGLWLHRARRHVRAHDGKRGRPAHDDHAAALCFLLGKAARLRYDRIGVL